MTYSTLANALLRLGRNGELDTTTTPTLTEAATIHDGISADVDAALSEGGHGSVPVTSPAALLDWLEAVESWGLCAEVLKVRFQDLSGSNTEGAWTFFEQRYQEALTRIRDGGALAVAGSSIVPESYYTKNPDEEAEDLGDLLDDLPLKRNMDL